MVDPLCPAFRRLQANVDPFVADPHAPDLDSGEGREQGLGYSRGRDAELCSVLPVEFDADLRLAAVVIGSNISRAGEPGDSLVNDLGRSRDLVEILAADSQSQRRADGRSLGFRFDVDLDAGIASAPLAQAGYDVAL